MHFGMTRPRQGPGTYGYVWHMHAYGKPWPVAVGVREALWRRVAVAEHDPDRDGEALELVLAVRVAVGRGVAEGERDREAEGLPVRVGERETVAVGVGLAVGRREGEAVGVHTGRRHGPRQSSKQHPGDADPPPVLLCLRRHNMHGGSVIGREITS